MATGGRARVGILDHTGPVLGGAQLVVAHMAEVLSREHDVEIMHSGRSYCGLEMLGRAFGVDLEGVRERRITEFPGSFSIPGPRPFLEQIWNPRHLSQRYDLFVYSGHGVPPFCYARRGLAYCHFPVEWPLDEELESNPRWLQRGRIDRWLRRRAYGLLWWIRMRGYTAILANSYFTAGWIERRYGKVSEVLYPPVEVDIPRREKRNLIVSLGRFTGGRGGKNQHRQVVAFREVASRVPGDWVLCLIGYCRDSRTDRTYLDMVERAAKGLRVKFLLNADRRAVCDALGEAKLFWHTSGLSIDEQESPQEAEHFGIATVEAMRAGCVPIVIGAGGQREIIENGVSGFLCKDLEELAERTVHLANEEGIRARMSKEAEERSMAFAKDRFDRQFRSIVSQCLGS